jgi:hypothetical protein
MKPLVQIRTIPSRPSHKIPWSPEILLIGMLMEAKVRSRMVSLMIEFESKLSNHKQSIDYQANLNVKIQFENQYALLSLQVSAVFISFLKILNLIL